MRKRPYSVVLLDEVEKAHRDVMNLFYQVFDRGAMRDGEGVNRLSQHRDPDDRQPREATSDAVAG